MKVPEKIYRHQTTGNPRFNGMYYEHKPAKIRYNDKIIEYIRKDAFIEKAKKWLYLQLNEINMEGEDMENFLKDFKSYMKGE